MKLKLFAIAAACIIFVSAGYAYFYFGNGTEDAPVQEISYYSVPESDWVSYPISTEITVENRRAAQEAFVQEGDRRPAQKYILDLRALILNQNPKASKYLHTLSDDYFKFGLGRAERDQFMISVESKIRNKSLKAVTDSWRKVYKYRSVPLNFEARYLDGRSFDIKDFRGKIVLLDFWNTACAACFDGMKRIDPIYQKYKDSGFEIISISTPVPGEDAVDVADAVRKKREIGIHWPVSVDASHTWKKFKAQHLAGNPYYVLLDRDGKLIAENGELQNGRALEKFLIQAL